MYTAFKINTNISSAQKELLEAQLLGLDITGLEDTDDQLLVYSTDLHTETAIRQLLTKHQLEYTTEMLENTNWNAQWEANFQPVQVGDFCYVHASFHESSPTARFNIEITPKMSFGTGHHATTYLMISAMGNMDYTGKKVFDFGTGTGILAILAEKLGAREVVATDNDEWCINNSRENVAQNQCSNIRLLNSDKVPIEQFEIILANINRHILLQHATALYEALTPGGALLMSGLLEADESVMISAYSAAGFAHVATQAKDGWISMYWSKRA